MDEEWNGAQPGSVELRMVLVGTIDCGKTLTADNLLGQSGSSASSRSCIVRRGLSHSRRLTLVEAPRWFWSHGRLESSVQEETKQALSLTAPGPHAFLLLIPVNQFTEMEQRTPRELEEVFGRGVLQHTLVVLTCGDYLLGRTAEEYLAKEVQGLREVIRLCQGRYHVLNNRQPDNREQFKELLEKVERMIQQNGGCYVEGIPLPGAQLPSLTNEVEAEAAETLRSVNTQRPGSPGGLETDYRESVQRTEMDGAEGERLERERVEREGCVREKAEQERLERESEEDRLKKRLAERRSRRERERREREQHEKAEIERIERERAERERILKEREREEKERKERERLEKEREEKRLKMQAEMERTEKKRAERETILKEREERERKDRERQEKEIEEKRLKMQAEMERIEKESAERERILKERREKRRAERERLEKERAEEELKKMEMKSEEKEGIKTEQYEKAEMVRKGGKEELQRIMEEREEKERQERERSEMEGKERNQSFGARRETIEERRERLQRARAERERLEQEMAERESAEALRRENGRTETEQLEQERREKERTEKERVEKERERLEQERREKERIEKERVEKEREKLEQARREKERIEKERVEKERERLEQARLEREKEKHRMENARLEKERVDRARAEKESIERERTEKERLERERAEKVRKEKERMQRERTERENQERGERAPLKHTTNGLHSQMLPQKQQLLEQQHLYEDKQQKTKGSSQPTAEGAILSQFIEPGGEKTLKNIYHRITTGEDPSPSAPELRLVLLGCTGSGKSAAGNVILGRREFESRADPTVTQRCEKGRAILGKRRVAVVDTPDWFRSECSPEEVRSQLSSCVALSTPGPHAFLFCVPLHRPPDPARLQALGALEGVFGPGAVKDHTLLLFTHSDCLEEGAGVGKGVDAMEEYIASKRPDLLKLVEKCGDRYHILERARREGGGGGGGGGEEERRSVEKLLEKVEQTVRESGGGHYSCPLYQEAENRVRDRHEEILQDRRERRSGGGGGEYLDTLEEEEEAEALEAERARDEAEKSVKLNSVPALTLPPPESTSFLRSVGQKVAAGLAAGTKMAASGVVAGAKKVPKPLAGGAVLGAGLGAFFGGLLGGAVGATGGVALAEVARRKLNSRRTDSDGQKEKEKKQS